MRGLRIGLFVIVGFGIECVLLGPAQGSGDCYRKALFFPDVDHCTWCNPFYNRGCTDQPAFVEHYQCEMQNEDDWRCYYTWESCGGYWADWEFSECTGDPMPITTCFYHKYAAYEERTSYHVVCPM